MNNNNRNFNIPHHKHKKRSLREPLQELTTHAKRTTSRVPAPSTFHLSSQKTQCNPIVHNMLSASRITFNQKFTNTKNEPEVRNQNSEDHMYKSDYAERLLKDTHHLKRFQSSKALFDRIEKEANAKKQQQHYQLRHKPLQSTHNNLNRLSSAFNNLHNQ